MNSRAKYEQLISQPDFMDVSHDQRSVRIILQVIAAAYAANQIEVLVDKAAKISNDSANLSPVVVLQLAAEEAKVDELCN